MTTLTDRYVYAATRSVPDRQRSDLARELRERIGDVTDALVADGHGTDEAERAALTELGDPAALAAGYLDRPLFLIGPRYFLVWWRLLKLLWWIVLPLVATVMLTLQIVAGANVGTVIGTTWGTTLTVAAHIGFWTTLVFALIDRMPTDDRAVAGTEWTLEHLPPLREESSTNRLGELIASLVFLGFMIVAITVWQRFAIPDVEGGGTIELLNPELWSFWLPYLLVVLVLDIGLAVLRYRTGPTWMTATANLLLSAAFTIPALWLFVTRQLLNPIALDAIGWPWGEAGGIIVTIIVIVVIAVAIVDAVDWFVKAWRASRQRLAI